MCPKQEQVKEMVNSNSEKLFQCLIENGQDSISLLAADGTLIWENPSKVHTLGYTQGHFVGRNIFELMHPDDMKWSRIIYLQVVKKPASSQDGVLSIFSSDGTWRWIEATVTNLLHEPSVQAIVVNYRDITERKQVETELRKLFHAVEQSANMIAIVGSDGIIEYVNPKFSGTTGFSLPELLEEKAHILDFCKHDTEIYQNIWQTIKAGQVWRGEIHNRRKDGEYYWETCTITPVYDLTQNLINFIVVEGILLPIKN